MWTEVQHLFVLINASAFRRRNLITCVAVLAYVYRHPLKYGPVNHAVPRLVPTVLIGMPPLWRDIVNVGGDNKWGHVDSCRCRSHGDSVTRPFAA